MRMRTTAAAAAGWRLLVPAAAFLIVFTVGALSAEAAGRKRKKRQPKEESGLYQEAEKLRSQALDLENRKRFAEAEALLERVIEMRVKVLGANDVQVAGVTNFLGRLRYKQGKFAEAEPTYLKAKAIYTKIYGADIDKECHVNTNLCRLYLAQGRLAEARPLAVKKLAARRSQLAAARRRIRFHQQDMAHAQRLLAQVCVAQGRFDEAEKLYRKTLVTYIKNEKGFPRFFFGYQIVESYYGLGQIARFRGRFDKADSLYREAIKFSENSGPAAKWSVYQARGDLYRTQGNYKRSVTMYLEAITILERAVGPSHPNLSGILEGLAQSYIAQGRKAEGQALIQRSKKIWNATFGKDAKTITESKGVIASLPGSAAKRPSMRTTRKPPAAKPPAARTERKPPVAKPRPRPVARPNSATRVGGTVESRLVGSWRVSRLEGTAKSNLQEMVFRADGSVDTAESDAQKKSLFYEVRGDGLSLKRSKGRRFDPTFQIRFEGETLVLVHKKRNRTFYLERAGLLAAKPPAAKPSSTRTERKPPAAKPPEPEKTVPKKPAVAAPAAPAAPVVSDFPIEDAPAGDSLAQARFYYEKGLAHLKRACPGGRSPDPDKDARAALRYFDRAIPLFEKARADHPAKAAEIDEKIAETCRLRYGSFKMQKVHVW